MNTRQLLMLAWSTTALAALVAPFASSSARAWCDWEDGWPDRDGDGDADPPLPYESVLLFEASTNMEAWDDVIGGMSLSSTPGAPDEGRAVIEHWMDSAAQSWNRVARSPVKVAFAGFDDEAAVDVADGKSSFAPSTCVGYTGIAIPGLDGMSCDIEFCRNQEPHACATSDDCETFGGVCREGVCEDPLRQMDERAYLEHPRGPGTGGGLQRTLRHEIGHCLGLYHVCDDDEPDNPYCQDVCTAGSLMQTPNSDQPSGDDIEGLQNVTRADAAGGDHELDVDTYEPDAIGGGFFASCGEIDLTGMPTSTYDDLLPRREIVLSRIVRTESGFVALNDIHTHLTSAYLPRLDCTSGSSDVDCVMVRSFDGAQLRVHALDANGGEGGTNPKVSAAVAVTHVHTRRTPDIALSRDTDTAVAVVSTMTPPDDVACQVDSECAVGEVCIDDVCRKPCDPIATGTVDGCAHDEVCGGDGLCSLVYNRPRNVAVHRFAKLAALDHESGGRDGRDGRDGRVGRGARARVQHSTLELPVVSTNDSRVAYVRGRGFLVVVARLDRSPALYLSGDDGQSFVELSERPPESELEPMLSSWRLFESFDVHCPTHIPSHPEGDRVCQIVFDPIDNVLAEEESVSDERGMTATGNHVACAVRIGSDGYRVVGCSDPGVGLGGQRAPLASISDYGGGIPSTQLGGPHWVISTSTRSPHLGPRQVNTWLGMWSDDDEHPVLSPAVRDPLSLLHSIDATECASMTSMDKPMSYFGGTSTEYCEDCDSFLVARWASFDADDVPDDACY